jgi:hypothetical protein
MCNAKLYLYSTVCCDALLAFTESKSTFQLLLCNQSNDLQCQPSCILISVGCSWFHLLVACQRTELFFDRMDTMTSEIGSMKEEWSRAWQIRLCISELMSMILQHGTQWYLMPGYMMVSYCEYRLYSFK